MTKHTNMANFIENILEFLLCCVVRNVSNKDRPKGLVHHLTLIHLELCLE